MLENAKRDPRDISLPEGFDSKPESNLTSNDLLETANKDLINQLKAAVAENEELKKKLDETR